MTGWRGDRETARRHRKKAKCEDTERKRSAKLSEKKRGRQAFVSLRAVLSPGESGSPIAFLPVILPYIQL